MPNSILPPVSIQTTRLIGASFVAVAATAVAVKVLVEEHVVTKVRITL